MWARSVPLVRECARVVLAVCKSPYESISLPHERDALAHINKLLLLAECSVNLHSGIVLQHIRVVSGNQIKH